MWNPVQQVWNAVSTMRLAALRKLLDQTRNIDQECGYPTTISVDEYRGLYERFSLAKRIVCIWPKECWKVTPKVYDSEDPKETPFEEAVKILTKKVHLWHYLGRIDELSGIGQYGVLLIGLDDKQANLKLPAKPGKDRKVLYLRAFDEYYAKVSETEKNANDPRYGWPTVYQLNFTHGDDAVTPTEDVHWTRTVHVADNRGVNETHGEPRLKGPWNHLLDLKKLAGGSAEMFWKGGFPGYAFGLDPRLDPSQVRINVDEIKDEIEKYSEGLKRYLNLTGVIPHSLQPQVADPKAHFEVLVKLVSTSVDVPYRILFGSEEARLASSEDKKTWHERVAQRQNDYLTPMVVRPTVDRFVALGVLPPPENDDYEVEWPDLDAPTEADQAKVAKDRTEAMEKYVRGEVDLVMPPKLYWTVVHKFTEEEAEAIEKEREAYQREEVEREEERDLEGAPAEPEPEEEEVVI